MQTYQPYGTQCFPREEQDVSLMLRRILFPLVEVLRVRVKEDRILCLRLLVG